MLYSGERRGEQRGEQRGERREGGQPVRVQVDVDACEANGVCAGLVPEVFELDDDDSLHVLAGAVPAELVATVQLAVRSCPKAALRLAH